MSIKYKISTIENSKGEGSKRDFVRVIDSPALTERLLEERIRDNSSLTEGDVKSALCALRELMIYELLQGKRFYLPSIGSFSLSVDLHKPEDKPIEKVRGDYISVRNILFRPDKNLLREVKHHARFERSTTISASVKYEEQDLAKCLREYLEANNMIDSRTMRSEFGLKRTMAQKWLKHFVETGLLKKVGARNAPLYFLNE